MSACCLARTLSSPLVGWIYAAGGSAAAWFSLAGVAFLGIVQLFWVPNELGTGKVRIENGLKEVMHAHQHDHHHPSEQDIDEVAVED
jgi:hypothetical protein